MGPVSSRVPWISISTIWRRRHGRKLLRQLVVGDDVHGLGDEEVARLLLGQDLGEEVAHLMDLGEPLQDRDELPVLPLGDLEIDDVVVEEVLPVTGRDGLQLRAGRVYQHGGELTDFGGDFDCHEVKLSG